MEINRQPTPHKTTAENYHKNVNIEIGIQQNIARFYRENIALKNDFQDNLFKHHKTL